MAITQVTYRVDAENNAERWWDAFRAERDGVRDSDSELYDTLRDLERDDEVTLHDPRLIEAFDAFVTGLPGWEGGPAYAPNPLVAQAE